MVHTGSISIWTRISRLSLVGLLLFCAALPRPAPVAAEPLFGDPIIELAPPQTRGYNPANPFADVSLHVADLDGDGLPDLVGVAGSAVSVAWGNDDGSFTPPSRWLSPSAGSVIDDLNADGHPDLIMGSSGATLAVFLGQADRNFLRVQDPLSKKRATALAVGDFDEDGLRDIVNVTSLDFLALHPGNGDGTFRPFAPLQVTWRPTTLLVADLNGDGHDDIAAGTMHSDVFGDFRPTISVLLGRGDGTFEAFVPYSIEDLLLFPIRLVGGDFDGDGDLDLVVVGSLNGSPAQMFRNRGNGIFEPGRPLGEFGGTPAVGDLNGDGLDDLALCASVLRVGRLALFHGDTTSLLVPSGTLVLDTMPLIECKTADLDGDGDLDLAGVDAHGYAHVLTNDGDGNFTFPGQRNTLTGISPQSLVVAQLDADRIPDLAFVESDAVVVLRGAGNGSFGEPQRLEFTPEMSTLAAGRLDGDDIDDLAVTLEEAGQVAVFHGSPDGTLVPGQVLDTGVNPYNIALAPLNGDTTVDIVVPDFASDTIVLFFNDGEGSFSGGRTIPVGTTPWTLLAADLDGDGRADLVSGNWVSNDLSVVFGSGNGSFDPEIRLEVGKVPWSLAAGDLNNDGLWDLVASPNFRGRDTLIWLGAPGREFLSAPPITSALTQRHVAVDDLNGDGILDIFLAGSAGRLQVLLGRGDGTFTPEFTYAVPPSVVSLVSGDWDRDGRQDIAIATGNSITLLQNQGPFPAVSVPVELISPNLEIRQHTRTRGLIVMKIHSTDKVNAAHILPETIRLGGAPVRQAGGSGRYLCQAQPTGKNSQPDLRCEVEVAGMTSGPVGSVLLEGVLDDGRRIKGEATLNPE